MAISTELEIFCFNFLLAAKYESDSLATIVADATNGLDAREVDNIRGELEGIVEKKRLEPAVAAYLDTAAEQFGVVVRKSYIELFSELIPLLNAGADVGPSRL